MTTAERRPWDDPERDDTQPIDPDDPNAPAEPDNDPNAPARPDPNAPV